MGEKIFIARQDTLEKVLEIVSTQNVWGFIEHEAIKNPAQRIEYIGANKDYQKLTTTMGGGYSLGDWANFRSIANNKPYMVKADGTADYQLCETDYNYKVDGITASDVSNTDYNGGAFAWFPKVYRKKYKVGTDIYTFFAYEKLDGFTADGFIDPSNNELEGVWIPMFYGSLVGDKMVSLSGLQQNWEYDTAQERTAIQNFSSRAHHLGGPIVEVINDLLIMFAKTTDLQSVYGYGNCQGYVDDRAQHYGIKANAVVGGGQFFATNDQTSLNKIFHSIALGSRQQWLRDPFEVVVNGKVKVSKNYTYDPTGAAYVDTGVNIPNIGNWMYADKHVVVPGYGSIPVPPFEGSSATGDCCGTYVSNQQQSITAVALRFAYCYDGAAPSGARARGWNYVAGNRYWHFGVADLLLPPVGAAV